MERKALIAFAQQHAHEDPLKLLLQQQRYPNIDLREVAQQLEGKKQALTKWPTLALCEDYLFPPKLNREQSSSEATARYKSSIFHGENLADLTGGMGIDSFFFAQRCQRVEYIEQQKELFSITENNFQALGVKNIICHCGDSIEWITDKEPCELIYIDPARRNSQGHKVSAFEDCTPNLLNNLEMLLSHCQRLAVKASPMIDIHLALQQLQSVNEIHIIAVGNECKEVLFILQEGKRHERPEEIPIHCVNLHNSEEVYQANSFTMQEEEAAEATYCAQIGHYLYEPHASIMKGGCFNSICHWYGVEKLARNTHLYSSDQIIADFPGRKFEVLQAVVLNKKSVANILPQKQAHVTVRNYPIAAAELQRRLGIKEGGDLFIVAATLGNKPLGWLCRPIF